MLRFALWFGVRLVLVATLLAGFSVWSSRTQRSREIAYVQWSDSSYAADIHVLDVDHQLDFRLTPSNARYVLPRWSPDGTHIAYLGEQNSQVTVYVANADGLQRRALFSSISGALALVWSPDGRYLLTLRPIDLALRALYLIEVETGVGRDLVQDNLISPAWSPDGTRIAYYTQNAGPQGDIEIWLIDLAGGEPRFLSYAGRFVGGLTWSPDGRRLALSSSYRTGRDVLLVDVETGELVNLTQGQGENFDPQWSPDGASLAYLSNRDGQMSLYIQPLDDQPRALTAIFEQVWSPQWSPDGTALAVIAPTGLYVLAADGRLQARLPVSTQRGTASPVWRP